ncbi:unnamed protein product [Mytilus coruscus]|uniref:Uncharacterized protein n=1 Tax=Mytilus coruscus TaxID=42192 RepID=A0A6J8EKS2_MYTCO|nr:unnamed protein product [Mytilus coruscus]
MDVNKMDTAMSKNNDTEQEVLFTCSQPNPDTTPSIYNPGKRGKRGNPESPENLPVHRMEQCCKDRIKQIKEQDKELDLQYNKIKDLETRLENQEQYSRRTSVRFHNVPVPVDGQGQIQHPVNTDRLILEICQTKMNLDINIDDIGRTHVIWKPRNGKSQVIARFVSYRKTHLVYSNKKILKNDENDTLITENLTKFRTTLVQTLAQMKYNGNITAYWTADGKIFAKRTENSKNKIINEWEDINALQRLMRDQDDLHVPVTQASEQTPDERP